MAQQTAVEWLVDELTKYGYLVAPALAHAIIDETIKKAKELEKKQIMNAYITSDDLPLDTELYKKLSKADAERCYNETFKQKI
jgi:hypothetical protein